MKRKNINLFMVIVISLIASLISFDITGKAEGADFTISPEFSSGQTDTNIGYFSIKAASDNIYPLTIDVQNLDEKTNCSFEAQLVAASTTDAGNIDYTPSKQSIFHKPGPLLPDLVTKNMRKQSFSVEKGLSKKITFPIQIPKKGFNGEILGSIYILKIQNEKQHNNGLAITNNYAMTIPVLLSQDFEKKVMPELSLSNIKIKDLNGNTKITGKISNNKPTMFGHIKLKAWITKKNEDKQLYSNNSDGLSMAPQSAFEYNIDTNNSALKNGNYTYHTKLVSGNKHFELSKDFVINVTTREKIKKKIISEKKIPVYWFIIIIMCLIGLLLLMYLLLKRRGRNKNEKV